MRKVDYQKMMEMLAIVLRCPLCGSRYGMEATQVLREREARAQPGDEVLVHSDCGSCRGSMVFAVAMDGAEVFSVGMVTDLSSVDAEKFREAKAVTAREIFGLHEFLGSFDGDFAKALTS